ncbi:MAG: DNA-directed DNA polymerase [Candidatus Woesearchaeota archaeon]
MVQIQFYPVEAEYKITDDRLVMQLYGKTPDGRQICVQDLSYQPYFYVLVKKSAEETLENINSLQVRKNDQVVPILRTELVEKGFMGKQVQLVKVYVKYPSDIPTIRNAINQFEPFEADIPYTKRYLIDKKITPLLLTDAEGEFINARSKVSVFNAAQVSQNSTEIVPKLKILSIDIETYNAQGKHVFADKSQIIMIAMKGENFEKVIVTKKFSTAKPYIEFADSETQLIRKFVEVVDNYKPDIITGYFSDGFDLPFISRRAEIHGIKLEIGLDYSPIRINGKNPTAAITGICHLDIFQFIKRAFSTTLETPTLDLGSVAAELIGKTKVDVEIEKLADVYDNHPDQLEKFSEYNLVDAELTMELTTSLLPNIIELVKVVSLPLSEVSRMSFSQLVEWYLIKRASDINELVPNKPDHTEIKKRRIETYQGAFVYDPQPGLYKNICIFDFRSLYPSIIISHNISPETLRCDCCEGKDTVPDEKYWFCKKRKGFISAVIEELVTRRMRVKEIIKQKTDSKILYARQYALKTIANAMYGYLGFFMARWYCLECVESITSYGRYYIKDLIGKAQQEGFQILYGDTDSVFLALNSKTREEAIHFVEHTNLGLPGMIEIQFEGFYPQGIFVSAKIGPYGAKKRYALLGEDKKITIKGFEVVRRNISPIAKDTQEEVLSIILRENNKEKALKYVQKVIETIRKKQLPLKEVIVYTQLQKPLSTYAAVGPHVAVARHMQQMGYDITAGSMIQYVVCSGSGRIRDRAKLPEECSQDDYDSEYYVNNQIIPAVEKIFAVLGYSKEELVKSLDQKSLDKFF